MSRIAVMIGRRADGRLVVLGEPAEGNELKALKELRSQILNAGGILTRGKSEVKLKEMRVLSNQTSGGELFGACRW